MNAHSKTETPDPLECFPLLRPPIDPEAITSTADLSFAMSNVYLDVRALAWMQQLITSAFAEPDTVQEMREPLTNDRIDLFVTASNMLTKELLERVHFLGHIHMRSLESGGATERGCP
ncbi:hypothetical protein [Blastochloris tepida]|uniref:Uncharacterized protein n=1 Tax=Blastochloris tepida TaxID=2233851 RepID=A0A348G025_9HYPH|nr:hypothetical protein [Blastochloris tepida]BBF92908.1 hypothetical protein BLTE_15930 [Blastochloris tepida]